MKCKKCGNKINLTVFGMPNDICWGCLQEPEKEVVLDKNNNIHINYYKELLTDGTSEIPVPDSKAKWVKNANYDNNWSLEEKVFKLGKSWLHDKTELRIFGWTQEVMYGDRKGMIEAAVPMYPDEDGSDCELIGYYNSVAEAMVKIVERNHPEYGLWI